MSTSLSGPALSFSGVGSGLDTQAMVAALMNAERAPITNIQKQISTVNQQKMSAQSINSKLSDLKAKATDLYLDPYALQAKTATAADTSILNATAGTSASAGTYNIKVTQLAQNHTMASNANPALNAGDQLDITVAGNTASVQFQAGDTLQTFADRINNTSGAGVSASVVSNKLVLISKDGGTGNAMTLGGSAAATLGAVTTQAAKDLAATINGVAVGGNGNKVSGAVNGLDFEFKATGATTLTVGNDDAAITNKVQAFVDAYNGLVAAVKTETAYDPATKKASPLQGDSMVRGLQGQIRGILGAPVSGLPGTSQSLFDVGIQSSRDGTLTLDATKLSQALKADPNAVQKVFSNDDGVAGVGAGDGIARQVADFVKQFQDGPMKTRLTGYDDRVKRMNDRIDGLNASLAIREKTLKAQFQAMDTAVAQLRAQQADFAARLG